MKIKALITTLVLGSSSLALANPSWSGGVNVQASYGGQVAIRDHRDFQPQPIVRDHRDGDRDRDRDRDGDRDWRREHRAPISIGQQVPVIQPAPMPYVRQWMTIAQDTSLSSRGASLLWFPNGREIHALQLQACAGETLVDRIVVTYTSGATRVIEPDVMLSGSNRSVTVPLEYGRIAKIAIYGKSGPRGRYTILAG